MREHLKTAQEVHDEVLRELHRYTRMIKQERHLGPNAPVLEGISLAIAVIERIKVEEGIKQELAELKKRS